MGCGNEYRGRMGTRARETGGVAGVISAWTGWQKPGKRASGRVVAAAAGEVAGLGGRAERVDMGEGDGGGGGVSENARRGPQRPI